VSETKLAGRYVLVEKIAAGGMGAVHKATDERLGRTVAVKMLRADLAGDPRFVERFRREARAVAALSHPNIAGVFDYGEGEDDYFIVMEYVDGKDLAELMRSEGPLGPERSAAIAAGTLDALQHAHSSGVVHRDVKPGNIMVTAPDRGRSSSRTDTEKVKVTDFGIARAVGDSTLTATGSVLGTAHYLSPEQASGGTIGPATDQYATGIVLYEMLAGTVPFTGDSPVAIAMRHMSDELPAPSSLNPDVSPELDAIVRRATNKEAAERFPDAAAMADALRAVSDPTAAEGVAGAVPLGGTTSVLGGGGDTAVLSGAGSGAATGPAGARWDPQRIGRAVLLTFAALIIIALLLLFFRLVTSEDEDPTRSERRRDQGAEAPAGAETEAAEDPGQEEEESVAIPSDIVGKTFDDAEAELTDDLGLVVESSPAPSNDFATDIVIDSSPGPGSTVTRGDTVTLTVSTGPEESDDDDEEEEEEEEDDDDEEDDKPGSPPGKGPKESKGKGPKDKD